jgi:hypothetical protein
LTRAVQLRFLVNKLSNNYNERLKPLYLFKRLRCHHHDNERTLVRCIANNALNNYYYYHCYGKDMTLDLPLESQNGRVALVH